MAKTLLIHAGIAELCAAVAEDGVLTRYWSEMTLDEEGNGARSGRAGDVVLGRVVRVMPGIDAAFVDIGDSRDGFLNARDAAPGGSHSDGRRRIGELVREGEAILVQVAKDAGDGKGARLTANVTLPGRLLVFSPAGARAAVSRRIEEAGERARLTAIVEEILRDGLPEAAGAGLVARTAAISASAGELREDAASLAAAWADICAARDTAAPPATLHAELGAVERLLRDEAGADIGRVLVDDASAFAAARDYAARAVPQMAERIEKYEGREPLFAAFGIEDGIAALAEARVDLPSGGWIVIEGTSALTAIDVNSGGHGGTADAQATALAVNGEAAEAIARQIALRGIGGLIAVDFLKLAREEDCERLAARLREALQEARIPAEVSIIPSLGLAALALRRRRRHWRASETCTVCDGHGRRVSIAGAALEVLRGLESAAAAGGRMQLRVSGEVAGWLEARKESLRPGLARLGLANIGVIAEPARARESFEVETLGAETEQ